MIGKTLGHYRITAPIGAGGMGEVYRATDTKLGRDVALKMLPAEMAADPERLERFQREARTLAALNHPNIVTIFSVEESGITRFLAMELIEGDTLDTIIAAGGLSLSRFLEISVPLADAISAAHERGIVHRDLKPGNVMVTREGRVKVLDFGLARLGGGESGHDLSKSPTGTHADLTGEGQVFGTVAYMSPEQARGAVVDARSDVFSLGVVLYQMLTGERPFTGSTAVDIITSILRDKPPSVTDLRADLPSDVGRILRRCLEKVPRDRYQTSRDVYNELRELRAEASSVSVTPPRSAAPKPATADSDSGRTRAQAFWIAVLPFTHSGADAELAAFAEGLSEDINAGLAKFPYLSVLSRNLTVRSNAQASDPRSVASQLGARYFLEGGIRKGGSALRINVQLVDAQTGAHLWAETYNRDLKDSDIFAVQDGISARVVATVADSYGVLVHSMTAMTGQKADEELAPSEWLFQYFAYRQQLSPPAHTAMKERLERAVERQPGQADLWACLAQVFTDEYAFGFRSDPTSLDRALAAARRAVELDRGNQLGMVSLAQAYFFRRDLAAFRPAAEQAMALNRLNTDALGILGLLIVHTGEFERGAAIVRRGMELNPNHAGWFHFGPIWEHFHAGEYDRALEHAMQVNMPGLFWQPLVIAAIFGQLGRPAEAAAAVGDLLALDPGFAEHARRDVEVWHFASGLLEPVLDGVRKGGLGLGAAERGKVSGLSTPSVSGAARADQGFRVAVLPFTHSGAPSELEFLAEGLSEDINAGLAKFPYLSVISRSSVVRLKSQASDVRAVGRQLGARYVLEGGIRKSASALRIHVQLVDAQTGAHVWAETYNRELDGSNVLAVQDDVTDCVVASVADTSGALVRSMAATVEEKPDAELTASDCVLRHCRYQQRGTPDEHARVRDGLEAFVERAPGHAEVWACLGRLYVHEFCLGFNPRPEPLDRALRAAQRAVDLDPTSQHARNVIAQVYFFRREVRDFRTAANHAIALNPRDTDTLGVMGNLFTDSGDFERGPSLTRRAMHLNPHHPDWLRFPLMFEHFQKGDYEGALEELARVNMPGFFWKPMCVAACCGLLGRQAEAAAAVQELRRLDGYMERHAREFVECWLYASGLGDRFLEGLQKAGLEIAAAGESAASKSESPRRESNAAVAIAVLPFSDMSPAKDQEYLCEGMAEEIMNALVRVPGIHVASRTSSFRAREQGQDLAAIARALNVGHLLEGSVRTGGDQIRVTAQLTDVATGFQLWSERFDRKTGDIFSVQDEITAGVVEAVKARLAPGQSAPAPRPQLKNLEAYQLYLKGRHLRYSKNDHAGALKCFEEAVALDPSHGPSWVGLADVNVLAASYGMKPARTAHAAAKAALATAAGLQGESVEALYVEGLIACTERRWRDSERLLGRAMEIDSGHVQAHCWRANLLCIHGHVEEAILAFDRAREIDPLAPYPYAMAGLCLLLAGRIEEAERSLDQALAFDEGNILTLWVSGVAAVAARRFDVAISRVERALAASHGAAFIHALLGWAMAAAGRTEEARRVLEVLRSRPAPATTLLPEAWLLAALGDRDGAFQILERAMEEHHLLVAFTGLPGFDGLRSDPRFAAFRRRLGLPAERGQEGPPSGSARIDEGFWIAVLPFKSGGDKADLAALAGGMSEEIVAGLSRFSYLRVITGASTSRYAAQSPDVREVGRELGARYVLNGTLRLAGARLRVAVALVDASSGAQLWADTYERPFSADAVFELQDDLVSRIVSTVGDPHGILPFNMSESLRSKTADQLSPYEAVLRSFGFGYRSTAEEHAVVRDVLEGAVRQAPDFADAWAMLSLIYSHEHAHGFNASPDPLGRALEAARRAVALAPTSAMACDALAFCLFFRKDIPAFRVAADRAIALNPLSSPTLAGLGTLIAYSGEWDSGCALVERAVQLNPRHPGWYRFALYTNAYRQGDYRGAVEMALKLNLPDFFVTYEVLAAAYGQLGEKEEGRKALRELLRLEPNYPAIAREKLEKWLLPDFVEHWLEGIRKAGLEIPAATKTATASASDSGATSARIDEGFWIAVLPFKYGGGDAGLATLAESLTSEIVTGLSRFSYLRVIARKATAAGARYVMEGTLREAAGKLRLAVQIVDTASGAHLWAETYERAFDPRALFELQDDLVPRIVSTVADMNGALPRSLSEAVRGRAPEDLSPYEAVLRSFGYFERLTREELSAARSGLEAAVRKAPDHADAWAMLALLHVQDYAQAFGLHPDPLAEGAAAARRAVDAAPSHPVAWFGLAQALFFLKEFESFRNAAERAVALNPMDGNSIAFLGEMLTYAGFEQRGMELAGRAKQLNPNHPGWYWYADFYDAYRQGDDRAAVNAVLKVNMHAHIGAHFMMAAAYGQLGEKKAAAKALGELLALKPDFASVFPGMAAKWWNPNHVERLADGLRKAGLEIPAAPA